MATNTNPKPEKCPECGGQTGFTSRGVRFKYDVQSQIGSLEVTQILRAKITNWECDDCHSLIEVWHDLS